MLTACVVNADCARTGIGNNSKGAPKHRFMIPGDIDFSNQGPAWAKRIGIGCRDSPYEQVA
jgi:hypothetical protein